VSGVGHGKLVLRVCAIVVLLLAIRGLRAGEVSVGSGLSSEEWQELLSGSMEVTEPSRAYADTIVMFSDYQCVFCRRSMRVVRDKTHLAVFIRHMPVATVHPHALRGAKYAICAAKQGKAREIHTLLFDDEKWTALDAREVASRVSLKSPTGFETCLGAPATRERVTDDLRWARRFGLRGTPAFARLEGLALGAMDDRRLELFLGGR